MPDLYLKISRQPEAVIEAIAASMNTRANEPAMVDICRTYMSALPKSAQVVEVGCGNGASTEHILRFAEPAELVGIDPSAGLLEKARQRFSGNPAVRFGEGDAVTTGLPAQSCDLVIAHTVFSHLSDPQAALAEAFRILRPGGTLAVFDGDYATNTVALFDGDPLQAAMTATQRNVIHDGYIMRRLPKMLAEQGFRPNGMKAHGYVQTNTPDYLVSLMDRGVDAATAEGDIGAELAVGFKAESRRRVAEGEFYGAILFVSVTANKP